MKIFGRNFFAHFIVFQRKCRMRAFIVLEISLILCNSQGKTLDRCFALLYGELKSLVDCPTFDALIEMCTICSFAACTCIHIYSCLQLIFVVVSCFFHGFLYVGSLGSSNSSLKDTRHLFNQKLLSA